MVRWHHPGELYLPICHRRQDALPFTAGVVTRLTHHRGLAYAETPLLSPGSPVESTCTCPGQLTWLVALKLIKEEELPGPLPNRTHDISFVLM